MVNTFLKNPYFRDTYWQPSPSLYSVSMDLPQVLYLGCRGKGTHCLVYLFDLSGFTPSLSPFLLRFKALVSKDLILQGKVAQSRHTYLPCVV